MAVPYVGIQASWGKCSINTSREINPHIGHYKDITGYGFFTAAAFGTRCPAHEYGTTPKVECRIHAPGIEFHTLQP